MLAIVFGLEKFHHYTYVVPGIRVVTDHKPLVAITNKPLSKAPRRFQAMLLRLQPYSIKVEYQPGSTLAIADTLSRAPLPNSSRTTETVTVNNLQWMPVKRHTLDEIRGATEQDGALQKLRRVITNGWPRELADVEAEVKPYFSYRDELTTQDSIILRGDRIVIRTSMRKEVNRRHMPDTWESTHAFEELKTSFSGLECQKKSDNWWRPARLAHVTPTSKSQRRCTCTRYPTDRGQRSAQICSQSAVGTTL